ncbi:ATP-binding cassette domain-containing protein [Candidatus Pelagibacter sp.]|nr:ATP-binding cassette domain-containing protein [Candidatus Pelagibacter sp.]
MKRIKFFIVHFRSLIRIKFKFSEPKKNETIGIIEKSGVGKSTLINLIIGLLNPDKGNIQVDGKDIQNDVKSWYNLIGYIPAACYLLDDTIRNNIAFGVKEQNIYDEMIKKSS